MRALHLPLALVTHGSELLEMRLENVMPKMTHRRDRHIPVIEIDQLRGIVGIVHMVKSRLEDREVEASVPGDYNTAR